MKRLFARATLLVVVCASAVCGQGFGGGTPARTLGWNTDTNPPPFTASLLVVKSDWSKAPAAKEIEAELRAALTDASVPQDLLEKLPASGAQVLFPRGIATYYTGEHYAELTAWLKAKGVLVEAIPFRTDQVFHLNVPGTHDDRWPSDRLLHSATLLKGNDFIDLPSVKMGDNIPFVKREPAILWSVRAVQNFSDLFIERRLVSAYSGHGAATPSIERINDEWTVWTAREDDRIAVINAFPEPILQDAAQRKGIAAAIVVNRRAGSGSANAQPKLVLPDEVELIEKRTNLDNSLDGQEPVGAPSEAAASADAASPATVDDTNDPKFEAKIKVFTLRNLKAIEAERIIRQLFDTSLESIAADQRTNSLIVSTPRSWPHSSSEQLTNTIHALLVRLDEPDVRPPQPVQPIQGEGARQFGGMIARPSASSTELAGNYEKLESETNRLARQIRELRVAPQAQEGRVKELTAQLSRVVGEAFAARQQLHQAGLSELQQRIVAIEQTLKTRERLSKEIIERRMKDLLNPDLQWEAAESVSSKAVGSSGTSSKKLSSSAERPKSTSRIWWGPETYEVLAALRVEVQELTRDDVPEPRYEGALKITAINSDRLASSDRWGSRLAVGDIILAIQTGGAARPNYRRVTLNVVRGNEHLPISIELPSATPTASDSTKRDALAARAVRDKLRERWEQVEKLFEFGRIDPAEMMQAAKDVNESEVAAAASAAEKREALGGAVERWKRIKSIVDAKVAEGAEPGWRKLGVDAEVLKAEAELAAGEGSQPAEKTSGESRSQSWRSQPAAPSVIPNTGGQTVTLRSPDEFRRHLASLKGAIESTKATELSSFAGKDDAERAQTKQKIIDATRRNLDFLGIEYTAQIRLLELDVDDAKSAAKAAEEQRTSAEQRYKTGEIGRSPVIGAQRAVQEAQVRLERANTLLELYRRADPKQAEATTAEPELPATTPKLPQKPKREL